MKKLRMFFNIKSNYLFTFRRFFVESYIDQKNNNQKQQIRKSCIVSYFCKTHKLLASSLNLLAITKEIIPLISLSINPKIVSGVGGDICGSIKTIINQPADKFTKRSESTSSQLFICKSNFSISQAGFFQILIMIVLGIGLVSAGLIYNNPFKNVSKEVVQVTNSPSPSPTTIYNETQQDLIKNKEYLMEKNNLTEEGFETYLKMAKDEEF
jgi:hypothetical protein